MTRLIMGALGVGLVLSLGATINQNTTTQRASAPSPSTTGTYTSAGVTRTYQIHLPNGYSKTQKYPLMISLHGTGGTGIAQETISQFDPVADAHQFIVVYPDAVSQQWQPQGTGNDIDAILALVTNLSSSYKIDRTRIYVSGLSDGGGFAQILACTHADTFAGFASVANNLTQAVADRCAPIKPIASLFMHGTADPVSPYLGGTNYAGVPSLSTSATAAFWAKSDHCSQTALTAKSPGTLTDGTTVTNLVTTYAGCASGVKVMLYSLSGAGHTWPGGVNIDTRLGLASTLMGSQIIWNALSAYHR